MLFVCLIGERRLFLCTKTITMACTTHNKLICSVQRLITMCEVFAGANTALTSHTQHNNDRVCWVRKPGLFSKIRKMVNQVIVVSVTSFGKSDEWTYFKSSSWLRVWKLHKLIVMTYVLLHTYLAI